jgi:hypothetical protein
MVAAGSAATIFWFYNKQQKEEWRKAPLLFLLFEFRRCGGFVV